MKRTAVGLLTVLLLATLTAAQQVAMADDTKWRLWSSEETQMRGANIYQQQAYGDPWCSKVETCDVSHEVGETARRHGHRASDIFFELYTRPPDRVLLRLYAGA